MSHHPLRKFVNASLASQLTGFPFLSRGNRRPIQKKASRPRPTRLRLELLEDRVLLSASISGTVLTLLPGATSQTGLAGQVVYLNQTPSGTFATTVKDSAPTFSPSTLDALSPQLFSLTGGSFGDAAASALQVQGVPSTITDLAVNLNDLFLPATASGPVTVGIISPSGAPVPDFPNLFNIQPGETFNGTFDGNTGADFTGSQVVNSPATTGTFQPQQFFDSPQAHIYDGSPDGTWGLVFLGAASDLTKLTLSSWSLTFTASTVSTMTGSDGSYSFAGLQSGKYTVSAADSSADVVTAAPPNNPAVSLATDVATNKKDAEAVVLNDGDAASNVNFSVQPAPDLTGVAFNIVGTQTISGQLYDQVQYTLTNQGNGAANKFSVDVRLSTNGNIDANGPLLTSFTVASLAAHTSTSGNVLVPIAAGTPTTDSIGFIINSPSGQTEGNTANNSNQGAGIDLALLGASTNQQLTTNSSVQQQPSIAVDPNNPNHIVVAYLDYSLLNTGYAGISIQYSLDGGSTWQPGGSITLPASFSQGAAQPTVQFDDNGNVFVSFAAATFLGTQPGLTSPNPADVVDGFTSNNGIFVVSGDFVTNGANTTLNLNAPTAVTENLYTGTPVFFDTLPEFAVDTSSAASNGNLYVTWTRFYPKGLFPGDPKSTDGSDNMIAVSTNHGASWTTEMQNGVTVIRDPGDGANDKGPAGFGTAAYSDVTVGPQGDVYVSAYAGGLFTVYHSTNAGQSFTPPNYNTGLGLPFGFGLIVPLSNLFFDNFRTFPVRDIIADPKVAGRLYAVDATTVNNSTFGPINAGTIVFAVSNDNGLTWQNMYTVGADATNFADLTPSQNDSFLPTLNDDDGGDFLGSASFAQLTNAVISGQALPSIGVDANGNLTVIWYDARTDPSANNGNPGTSLDVFGTASTDGGSTFSPNFRISNQSFNPNSGEFADATATRGIPNDYFLGDHIDVVAVNGYAYAVWTGTNSGNQDIYFDKYQITPAPAPLTDRYSPNSTMATATNIGTVAAQVIYPRLNLLPGGTLNPKPGGSDEWFQLIAGASGELSVAVSAASGGNNLRVEVTDSKGNVITPTGTAPLTDAAGNVIGEELDIASVSGTTYYVHVFTPANTETAVSYTLTVETLTADLGTQVEGSEPGSVNGQNIYRLAAGVEGTLQVTLSGSHGISLTILGADGQTVLASGAVGAGPVTIQVTQGQAVFLQVAGAGAFTLAYTNFDQYEASGVTTLFIPTVGDPTSIVAATLTGDTTTSLLTTNTDATDTLDVLKGNGDGTFQAPQEYDIGPGQAGSLTAGNREIAIADLTNTPGAQDVIVPNFRAADVSVLLNNGAGGFQPQRTFDAVEAPDSLVTGDFGNGQTDMAVLQNFAQGADSQLAILLGRGDGTFAPATLYSTIFTNGADSMVTGDFTGNGVLDIIVFSKNDDVAQIFYGNGDGTFRDGGTFTIGENTFNATVVDLDGRTYANGKPILDLITTGANSGNVYVQLGDGKGGFEAPVAFQAMSNSAGDVGVFGLVVTNFAVPAGNTAPAGMTYGTQNIVVTAQPRNGLGAAEVILLPELLYANGRHKGHYAGYGTPIVLANVGTDGNIAAGDFGNGATDLAVADKGGITIIYGKPLTLTPNTTAATARDLGDAEHVVTQTQAIVTGDEDAFYTYTVPTEVVAGSGAQVIDFSALLQYVGGAGLQLDVKDLTTGQNLGSGQLLPGSPATGVRFRVVAAQGDVLQVHVSGLSGPVAGFGAYTLDIDVLPQVVLASVQAESAVPGAAATSLVLTLQGDRLDPTAAEKPNNYIITWLGPDGVPGSADNQVIPASAYSVIYNPDANVQVAGSGVNYETAARQTLTFTFASPLQAGSYEITVKPNIPTAFFSTTEAAVLVLDATLGGHQLVSAKTGVVHNGSDFVVPNLVTAAGTPDPTTISNGTPFLTQLQNDLSAILNSGLQNGLSDAAITAAINQEIFDRFAALFAAGSPALSIGVIWLDPVSLGVQAPQGTAAAFSLATGNATNNISQSYVSVGGNVEVVVLAGLAGTFKLDVANVPGEARGGAVVLDTLGNQTLAFTQALQTGTTQFLVNIPEAISTVGQTIGNVPGQVTSGLADASTGSTVTGGISTTTVATVAQTGSAILISALLTGFPDTNSGSANLGGQSNGNVSPTNGSTQTSSNGPAASAGVDGGGGGDQVTDGHSSLLANVIDKAFLDLPDSVAGFVDLADGLVQESAEAAKNLSDRINAFFKTQKPPAPMTMPPESLRTMPEALWRLGDKETRRQGDLSVASNEDVANAPPMDPTGWRANEYGLTLFLASGLGYISLRDLADRDSAARKKRRDIPLI